MHEVYRSPVCFIEGYRAYTVHYDTGKKTTVLEHREIMEKLIGRKLSSNEHVHHKDENKLNNSIDNLIVLPREAHALHHHPKEPMMKLICINCECEFERIPHRERSERKRGKIGPFCGRSCLSKYFSSSSQLLKFQNAGKSFSGRKSKDGIHASKKLNHDILISIRSRINAGESVRSIAKEFKVDHSTITYNLNKHNL